ncbi:MAG: zinc-dependent alcohol dehydrogenase family protein [Bacilli bacterium]
MRALVMEAARTPVVRDVEVPAPQPGEVLIGVRRCGICGTDLHIYEGDFLSGYPLIPGHEFAGVVAAVGSGVAAVRVGDRVAVDPSLFCGHCDYCQSDRGNHCVNWGAIGDTVSGAMAEFVTAPEANVFKLPATMTFQQGAFIEPVACVVHAMNQLQLRTGQSVLLFGAGSMGQLLIQALTHSGAGELAVVDVARGKLALALENGATTAYYAHQAHDLLANRKRHQGYDVVVDVTGIPSVIQTQFQYLAPRGTHLQFGVAPVQSAVTINPFDIYHNDWRLIGSMAINHTFLAALEWLRAGRVRIDPLVSGVIGLAEVPRFFAAGKSADDMKIQIEIS